MDYREGKALINQGPDLTKEPHRLMFSPRLIGKRESQNRVRKGGRGLLPSNMGQILRDLSGARRGNGNPSASLFG